MMLEALRATIGIPFRAHGRDPERGLDCVGVLLLPLLSAGVLVPEEHQQVNYPPNGDQKRLRDFLEWYGEETRVESAKSQLLAAVSREPFPLRALDVVTFGILGAESHLGVMLDQSRIVHAWYPNRMVIEHDLRGVWMARARSVYRCKLSLD